ncbi:DUF1294 domain-containing protein [Pseudomonas cichorii]|uniref:DUF1294 domain-containing protein n=1 Tax=Pseudomonas lijiangensis TaxID=2995658 RepID=A0ABX8HYD4_9PSED|nr:MULTISPECIES: DUF1294 domain-containing protein [Pseudomonas syringae group]MBX8501895.1 DUF1294 domain-containing protein [Pseudomonas lijiangensis]MBX8506730.1 DUF1294 domain-containing protein [Pseudomonas lijiangensis]MBX8541833.1 DUF1294 domain-containing protein [Pseudomonas cichorii]MBX8562364.1 DUF1294 domain-containing protein [Pseudomonas cichorii]MBX8566402.1 DUF1294 domain-containing protein [Pseudomonas cichorii]
MTLPRQRSSTQRPNRGGAPVQNLNLKVCILALLCVMPAYGAGMSWFKSGMPIVLAAYVLVSLLAFLIYRHDKRQAGNGGWRTPENVLHLTELLGGWPGALLGQQVFRHKTRKVSFQLVFWLIVLGHQLFWIDQLFLDSGWFKPWFSQLERHLQALR